jgi:DNA-binding SARP family transcriptional activator/TolB-like protein
MVVAAQSGVAYLGTRSTSRSRHEDVIRIHTLGGLSVRDSDGKLLAGSAAQPRRMAVLALLARAGERGVAREKLLALLWPDADDERGPRTLAQALYALRRDLGAEEAIAGAKDLRLDPALASSDVSEFTAAVSRGDDQRAAAVYEGPFLDGFHLGQADEFGRWVERERTALAQDYMRVLESLARGCIASGDALTAVKWWQRLAALEPLNARVAVGLMEALAAAGDRTAAIRHAHIYELLVQEELDLPPDKEVMALAERLRQGADVRPAMAPGTAAPVVVSSVAATPVAAIPVARTPVAATHVAATHVAATHVAATSAAATSVVPTEGHGVDSSPASPGQADTARGNRRVDRRRFATGWAVPALVVVLAATALFSLRTRDGATAAPNESAVVAVGRMVGYGTDSAARAMAGPVSDLFATSLARVPGLRVVSQGRMLELMRLVGGMRDTSAGGFVDAARHAGATEVIDGTLYARPGGRLRLDLRRVDLASGAIGGTYTIEGNDLFALVDSGTARLVTALGAAAPRGSVADVTTHSVAAYRMYAKGIQAYYRFDLRAALDLFDGALAEDSLFALAAYYGAIAAASVTPDSWRARLERARQLATRATDRERLIITADWALRTHAPGLRQIAESLTVGYPAEVEGYLYSGIALVLDGDFLAGAPLLERAVAMDSTGIRGAGARCGACEAPRWLVSAYELADSFPAAERVARRWLALQPGSAMAAGVLVEVLEYEGRAAAADSTFRAITSSDLSYDQVLEFQANHLIRMGDYASADHLLRSRVAQFTGARQENAYWQLVLSLREQGRLAEALDLSRRLRRFADQGLRPGGPQSTTVLEAQVQLERGQANVAAALFDSVARLGDATASRALSPPRVWTLMQVAGARRMAGDTATLLRFADSIQALGAATGFARDQRLYHHVRGLLLAARGRDAEAEAELRAAVYSLTSGYTRTNYELACIFLRARRSREAIAILQPALRGALDASNLYVSRTELQELLAKAWDASGARDSAAVHYTIVANAWSAGDAPFRARADSARARLAALKGQIPNAVRGGKLK